MEHLNDLVATCEAAARSTSLTASNTTSSTSITTQLQRLGDPSGRQDATYWDDWFQIVCRDNDHKPFEWYCDCQQVARVLKFYLLVEDGDGAERQAASGVSKSQRRNKKKRMIHPGSGTSLLPLALQADFPDYEHVVVDVSEVAIQEMKEIHSKQAVAAVSQKIEYCLANLLLDNADDADASSLNFEADSFQCWIDKGFVDAVFSKTSTKINGDDSNSRSDQQQANVLFQHACRILNSDNGSMSCHAGIDNNDINSCISDDDDGDVAGFALIVSLAEDHSLHLILDNWLKNTATATHHQDEPSVNLQHHWASSLDIWELVPVSGNMRPFGFVLTKANTATALLESKDDDDNVTVIVRWHGLDDSVQEIYNAPRGLELNAHDETMIKTVIQSRLSQSRKVLMDDVLHARNDELLDERLVMATLEVKPLDADVDLVALAKLIQTFQFQVETSSSSSPHRYLQPQWRPVEVQQEEASSTNNDNNLLLHEIIPIGYGLSKLVLTCILPSDDVDELVTLIEETFGNDHVQSVDVDWSRTIPVMSNVYTLQIPSASK
jgi:translation elongation factor EF-1beta